MSFPCYQCGEVLPDIRAHSRHVEEKHPRHCPTCDLPVTTDEWIAHQQTHQETGQSEQDTPQESARKRAEEFRGMLVDSAGLDKLPDPVPLIDGVLQLDTLAEIVGQPGHGKSFVALDMAGHIGNGTPWHGRTVRQGVVVYLVAEGVSGVKKRVRAWEKVHGPMRDVYFLPVAVQSTNATDWAAFIMAIRDLNPVLVVLDTQARITVGRDENSAKDMGEFVHHLEFLREHTGACVMPVHHQGRNGDHGRGSNAIDGAVNTIIAVSMSAETVTVKNSKQKDWELFSKIEFTLRQVDLGLDGEGRPVNSAVLEAIGRDGDQDDVEDLADSQARLVGLVRDHFGPDGATRAVVRSLAKTESKMRDSTFYKAWRELVAKKILQPVGTSQRFRFVSLEDRR